MTSRDYCFWLQGFFEVAKPQELTPEQTTLIRQHLALVFKHEIDPSMGPPKHQDALNQIHTPAPASGASTPPSGIVFRC